MNLTIYPRKLTGAIHAIPSKSQAHRFLICAAFADKDTVIECPETNQDIEATASCLNALGARILRSETGYHVTPIQAPLEKAELNCHESGSTLRFILPIVGALGVDTIIHMEGRLPQRPLSPLWEEMERMGCRLSRPTESTIHCQGRLHAGRFSIAGNISSQYISGLLFAMAIMDEDSHLEITGTLESKPYVDLTRQVLDTYGVSTENFHVCSSLPFRSPGQIKVEGDWSNAAFFLAANALDNHIHVDNLNNSSAQGDRKILKALNQLVSHHSTIRAADIPDLVPILSVVAAAMHGCIFTDVSRLRLKESDRVASVVAMLTSLGIHAEDTKNTLTVYPGTIRGGIVNSFNDHRIAMSAAIAATVADGPVTVLGANCVNKSYPAFWSEYKRLGGSYE